MAAGERNESIEEKTRKIVNKDVPNGEELQSFQEAQNQLLQIEAARKQNIQVDRATTSAQSQNNQTLAQAAEMMAATNGNESGEYGGPVQGRPVQFNPQTQAILGKYGYGKPKTQQSTQVSSGPVQGRGIIINNRTENRTTNNVQVSAPQTPVIQQKAGGDGGMAKFKTWLTNSFSKQKAQDTIREREYRRQEASLSRSSTKIMDKLEEVGKTIGERMDPRKVSNILMDQMKVLFFLLGFQFLSSHWKEILQKVANISEFFGIGLPRGQRSGFVKALISFMGGDPNGKETAFEVFKNLLSDAVNLLGERFKMFFEDRASAVKTIKFPTINIEDGLLGGLKALGTYLADILAAIVGGRAGIEQNIRNSIKSVGKADAMGVDAEGVRGWARKDRRFENAIGIKDTDNGDLASVTNNIMSSRDYDSSGNLANSTTASLTQGNSIAGMINDNTTSKIHTVGVMTGLENISNSANRFGSTLVTQEFIDSLRELGVSLPKLVKQPYKLVREKKTNKDFQEEGADIGAAAGGAYLRRAVVNSTKKATGLEDSWGAELLDQRLTGDIIDSPDYQAVKAGIKAAFKKLGSNDYTLKMVPASDPRPEVEVSYPDYSKGSNGPIVKKKFFYFYELYPKTIEEIKNKIGLALNNPEFKLDTSDKASMESLDAKLRELKQKKTAGRKERLYGNNGKIYSDYDEIKEQYSGLDQYNREHQQREEAWDKLYNESQTKRAIDNTVEGVKALADYGADFLGLDYHEPVPITQEQQKRNLIQAMNYFMDREGFTKEQAAGMVGSLMAESGLNPTITNNGNAFGIAQWLGPRKRALFEKYGQNPSFEQQLEFISHELDTTHKGGKKAILNARTVEQAADAAFGRFEFSAGVDGAVADMKKHNQNGLERKRRGRHLAQDVLLTYNGSEGAAGREWEESKTGYTETPVENSYQMPEENPASIHDWSKTKANSTKPKKREEEEIHIPFTAPKQKIEIPTVNWSESGYGLYAYNASSVTPPTAEIAKQTKDSKSDNADLIFELQKINDSVIEQGKGLTALSMSVANLATVAAANGNNTTVINNGGDNKTAAPTYTSNPNSWITNGYFNNITS